jgi:hypothetical protein
MQNYILQSRVIPDNTTWIAAVTNELGVSSNSVALTVRNQSRIFLIDTNGFSPISLPYTQTSSGASALPSNPRFMIVSSLGAALPGGLINKPGSSIFNDIWGTSSGNLPTNSLWSGWDKGNGADLIVQRINLAPLFVHLILTTNNSTLNYAYYSFDANSISNLTTSGNVNAYFLQNSLLKLYTTNTSTLDSQQILQNDISFVYDQNVWRSSIVSVSLSETNPPDFSGIVSAFMNAGPSSVTNTMVANDFVTYMQDYYNWANDGTSFSHDANYTAAVNAYTAMMNDVNIVVKAVQKH